MTGALFGALSARAPAREVRENKDPRRDAQASMTISELLGAQHAR